MNVKAPPLPLAWALVAAAMSVGCDNPAKGKPHATVSEPVAVASSGPSAAAKSYAINAENSKIEWTGAKVTGSHDGSFKAFTGSIAYTGAVETSKLTLDIDTTSLTTSPDKLEGHLKSPDFFDVQRFPKATFTSTAIQPAGPGQYTVTGNLNLHGVEKSISFPATISVAADAIDARATFSLNRKDFGLNYPGKADDLIRDDVVVKLTVHAQPAKT